MDREGREEPVGIRADLGVFPNPKISPDGDRIAVQIQGDNDSNIHIYSS